MADNAVHITATVGLAIGAVGLFYKYLMRHFHTHKRNGIPGPKAWPLFGSSLDMMKMGIFSFYKSMIDQYGKIVGIYMGSAPSLMISDLDILKQIMIKNFDQFTNRVMNPAINQCCRNMVDQLLKKCENDEVVDLRDSSGKYTLGVIASTTFGIEVNSGDENDQFVVNAKKIMAPPGFLKIVIFLFFPWLKRLLNISFFPKDTMDFFFGIFNEALKRKHEDMDPTARKNFLDIMAEMHIEDPKETDLKTNEDLEKSNQGYIYSKKGMTHEEILAQSFVFFLAGFDTTSILLSFLVYNLACYPDAQEKLYNEIKEVMGDQKEPDYDLIKQMTYLQMCLDESVRLYPPGFRIERVCNEATEINGLRIEKGMEITIPMFVIHRDPEIWPEPDLFKPERFTPEEKAARHPMAHMPFGLGPRSCIAMRLALMEVKLAMVHLVLNHMRRNADTFEIEQISNDWRQRTKN